MGHSQNQSSPLPQIIKFIHSERSMNWKKKEMLWKTILLWNQWNKNFSLSLVKNIHYVLSKIVYHFSDIKINFVILIISMNHYINPILSHFKRYKLTRRGRESSSQGHTCPGDLTPWPVPCSPPLCCLPLVIFHPQQTQWWVTPLLLQHVHAIRTRVLNTHFTSFTTEKVNAHVALISSKFSNGQGVQKEEKHINY